jgi:hypothetical protein
MTSRKASGIFRGRFGIFYFQLEFSAGAEAFLDVILRPPAEKSHLRFHGTVHTCPKQHNLPIKLLAILKSNEK